MGEAPYCYRDATLTMSVLIPEALRSARIRRFVLVVHIGRVETLEIKEIPKTHVIL